MVRRVRYLPFVVLVVVVVIVMRTDGVFLISYILNLDER
jgi:hypothetical protein